MQQFLERMKPSERLKEYRERLALDPHELARAIGISSAAYFDLEGFDDLENAISLGRIAALARLLGVKASALFSNEEPSQVIAPDTLASHLKTFMTLQKITVSEAGDEMGWALETFVDDPNWVILEWNVTCLRDVCRVLDCNWLAALNGIEQNPTGPRVGNDWTPDKRT
jgi:transcriptional regulator with XRE-family HTH domain